ncbi:protein NPAT isoform X2 [Microcaecilia unicolor]|uniref:Protein NPAT isoform X2 n=1 Tax=Microcaecilia unicolor TaxID=1415580 RepID=A0A6P7XZD4_9AMPH|nr:protein NPAT isoform X2 [Microcaecilia unicolor]
MLLPSDVARLVLGYLQQEKLTSTCQAFIMESSDLKEYAEHYTDDGCVPGCILSLFGKNLTTILNEYVTMKAKETTHDVPAMMSSLWKKRDYTLGQIRSMQNSTAFSTHQRTRTRTGLAGVRRQQALAGSGLLTVSEQTGQQPSPMTVANVVNRSASQARPNPLFFHHSSPDSRPSSNVSGVNLHVSLPRPSDKRQHLSLPSPGSRKGDNQKRRPMVLSGPHTTVRNIQCSSISTMGESDMFQELRDGNFPEMVIQNARDTILSNRCLQEKLAENINKFLGSDANAMLTSRQTDNTAAEPDPAFDEILALEGGEIHMSEEALQDILEQTASDPAFQGLFDSFEYGKTKSSKCVTQDYPSQSETDVLSTIASQDTSTNTLQPSTQNHNVEVPAESVSPAYSDSKTLKNDSQMDNSLQKIKAHNRCPSRFKLWKSTEKRHLVLHSPINSEQEKGASSVSQPTLDDPNTRQSAGNDLTVLSEAGSETVDTNDGEFTAISDVPGESRLGPCPSAILPHSQDSSSIQMEIISNSGSNEQHIPQDSSLAKKCISAIHELAKEPSERERMQVSGGGCTDPSADSNEKEENRVEYVTAVRSVQISADEAEHEGSGFFSVPVFASPIPVLSDGSTTLDKQHEVADLSSGNQSECGSLVLSEPLQNTLSVNLVSSDSDKATETDAGVKKPLLSLNHDNLVHPTLKNAEVSVQNYESLSITPNNIVPCSESADSIQSSSSLPEDMVLSSSNSQTVEMDSSGIVSLKIIISDEPSLLSDTELNNAISSITGDGLPTIIMSSPAKQSLKNAALSPCLFSKEATNLTSPLERAADSSTLEQGMLVLRPKDSTAANSINLQTEDGTMLSVVSSPHFSKDSGFLQLMPATSTSFGQSNSVFIATCVPEPPALDNTVTQSSIIMVPSKSTQPQLLQTPQKSSSMLAASQTSPGFTQGSTIIMASPVQPLVQGMMGMIPISIVGQNGTMLSPQVLHMPIAAPVGNQLPLPPKSQKLVGARNTVSGRKPANTVDSWSNQPGPNAQRSGKSEESVTADVEQKPEENCGLVASDTTKSNSKLSGSHRRVLCFDNCSSLPGGGSSLAPNIQTPSQSKEIPDYIVKTSISASLSGKNSQATAISKPELEKIPVVKSSSNSETVFSRISTSVTVREMPEKRSAPTSLLTDGIYKTTANKENELRGDEKQKSQEATNLSTYAEKIVPSMPEVRRQTCFPNILRRSYHEPKRGLSKFSNASLSLASPLAKQAGDMLQKLQWHSPAAKQADENLPIPRTPGSGTGDRHPDDAMDSARTPTCRRTVEEGGTPRVLLPPATPEMPACSPASEAGSENSVSMAAHTLMILSRAAIAKTSGTTPLKDNTQQPRSSRSSTKKRKLEELDEHEKDECSSSKKEAQSSTTPLKKKKTKKQKKRKLDSFPAEMDVDKFLLSLHYDE